LSRRNYLVMKKIFLVTFVGLLLNTGCRKEEPDVIYPHQLYYYNNGSVHTIPYGQTGYITNANLSGQGNQTVLHNTSLIINGNVTMDALTITGKVVIAKGANLTVTGTTTVVGGGNFIVLGTIKTNTLTQTGDTYLNNGKITVLGKYTIVGGSTLYIQNSSVHVNELIVTGNIQHPKNNHTQTTYIYSVIESINTKYLFITSGADICGPILFTTNNDQGSSGVALADISTTVITTKPTIYSIYGLNNATNFYDYQSSCSPLTNFPIY